MHHILIPTDFSKNAWNATLYALQFFKKEKTIFHFLNIDISILQSKDVNLQNLGLITEDDDLKNLHSKMNDWIQKIYTYHPNTNHNFKHTTLKSSFVNGIRDYVLKEKIELIIMGTKGASGVQKMTIGSRTGSVITRVKCPTLVIPEAAIFKKPLDIGFPTDFNMTYKNRVITTLIAIAESHKSSIKVLRVAQNQKPLDNFQNSNRDYLKNKLNHIPHSFHVIKNPKLENALQSFVNTMQIDIIAMIAKNINFFERILFKPKTAEISYHIKIPFLVLHE